MSDKSGIKVISNRTLDEKTIKINADQTAIEVGVSTADDNAVSVKDDGLYVKQTIADIVITDLSGNPLGKLVKPE